MKIIQIPTWYLSEKSAVEKTRFSKIVGSEAAGEMSSMWSISKIYTIKFIKSQILF